MSSSGRPTTLIPVKIVNDDFGRSFTYLPIA
jgi:hypothetical protein